MLWSGWMLAQNKQLRGYKYDRRKNKKSKLRAILSSLVFSVSLMIFPVTSGVIVVINGMDAIFPIST